MNPELRAAERLRAVGDDWRLYPYATAPDDAMILARAYLAEHPADDSEPVTEEWLRSVGFREEDLSWHGRCPVTGKVPTTGFIIGEEKFDCCTIGVRWRDDGSVGVYRLAADLFDGSEDWLVDVPTRGDVRRLCAALGATLTTSPAPPREE